MNIFIVCLVVFVALSIWDLVRDPLLRTILGALEGLESVLFEDRLQKR